MHVSNTKIYIHTIIVLSPVCRDKYTYWYCCDFSWYNCVDIKVVKQVDGMQFSKKKWKVHVNFTCNNVCWTTQTIIIMHFYYDFFNQVKSQVSQFFMMFYTLLWLWSMHISILIIIFSWCSPLISDFLMSFKTCH